MQDHVSDTTACVIARPPVIFLSSLALGYVINIVAPMQFLPERIAIWLGITLIIVSSALAIWAGRMMWCHNTAINPCTPTTAIVSDGPFSFSRNPLYLSLSLFYLGIASLLNAFGMLVVFLFFVLIMQYGVIVREERYLEQKFGDTYLSYKNRVRRWI
ncbi:MAG: isoprenylcysteine carboxylmethyltransferase family protein [Alphaproteobacteria bacterium]|nr:isoprenylcysteine carboxylmethyltransferase family protein [Alphaproteobacteria bacterium]